MKQRFNSISKKSLFPRYSLLSAFILLFLASPVSSPSIVKAEELVIGDKTYTFNRLIDRKIGPGTLYTRIRIPDYPLNVNIVTVDLNNPYNRIETTVANESAKGTEQLTDAARRLNAPSHHPLAAANANFWVVSSQKEYPLYSGITSNASVRNGKMVTESNQFKEKWDKGTGRTGVVSVSYDKTLNIDYCTSRIKFRKAGGSEKDIHQCNKGYRNGQFCMYNSFYGRDRAFMPYEEEVIDTEKNTKQFRLQENVTDATEVLLDLNEGENWTGGEEIRFTVKEVRTNTNGRGTLGSHDLAIAGRGSAKPELAVGDEVILRYSWTYQGAVNPIVEQAIGGNAMVMRHGKLTEHNDNETYNSQVYSRTGYGCSEDGKTLYMIVIDKSTDPVYGKSAGCSTAVMSEIARHFGCYNLSNFDAGGSAEMMVDYEIVNKTTEKTPRAVANGWMVFSTAPEGDSKLASIEFDNPEINLNPGESIVPVILGYNRYGELIEKNITDFTLSCPASLGECSGKTFKAGTAPATGLLTATVGNLSVSKTVTVGGGSAVTDIAAEATSSEPVYHDLAGLRCEPPLAPGIYVRTENGQSTSIIIR